jgi:hypothetical protein
MDEAAMRALLMDVADDDLPASTIDVTKAMAGGARRRLRRIYLPVLAPIAAAAAVALILVGVPLTVGGNLPSVPAVREFNPMIPYALFGWLPPGSSTQQIQQGLRAESLSATHAASGLDQVLITLYAAGMCRVTKASSTAMLACRPAGVGTMTNRGSVQPVGRQVGAVRGRPAYLSSQVLVWQYAQHSWAVFGYSVNPSRSHLTSTERAQVLRIARSLRFGTGTHPRFGFRLPGIPASWQPTVSDFQWGQGQIYGAAVTLSPTSSKLSSISVTALPASAGGSGCPYPGTHAHQIIDGHRFVEEHWRGSGEPASRMDCSADVDGVAVDIQTMVSRLAASGTFLGSPASIYRHLQLLGPDIANWTTRPIG